MKNYKKKGNCYICQEIDDYFKKLSEIKGILGSGSKTHKVCSYCFELVKEKEIGESIFGIEIELNKTQWNEFQQLNSQIAKDSIKARKLFEKRVEENQVIAKKEEAERIKSLENGIINLLKKHGTKMPASDIDAHLKTRNIDEIKEFCENMYFGGKINRTSNYRYFVLSEKKISQKEKSKVKSGDGIENELVKYKKMVEKGLISDEDYNEKKKQLLGL